MKEPARNMSHLHKVNNNNAGFQNLHENSKTIPKVNQYFFYLSKGLYCHYKISPRDNCIVAQLAFASFYRSQSLEMGTMLGEYLESVTN